VGNQQGNYFNSLEGVYCSCKKKVEPLEAGINHYLIMSSKAILTGAVLLLPRSITLQHHMGFAGSLGPFF